MTVDDANHAEADSTSGYPEHGRASARARNSHASDSAPADNPQAPDSAPADNPQAPGSARVRSSAFRRSGAFRFGDFELSLKSSELRRGGVLIRLQHQPCRVLAFLASHPGELITREELRLEIWPNGTFVDFEHGINFCIKQIRTALGDDAQSPLYIETLPRRGYRFIAPVQVLTGEPSPEPLQDQAAQTPSSGTSAFHTAQPAARDQSTPSLFRKAIARPWSQTTYALGFLVVMALLAGALILWRSYGLSSPPLSRKVTLAVMPFDYVGSDADQQFFADGLTEEMIMQLGSLEPRRLGVIARTSVTRYRQGGTDIKQIGRDLGVDYVLEGTVRADSDRVAITARLIQSRDQTQLWSQSFETARAAVLPVQKSIAARIASSLVIELLPSTGDESAPGATRDAQAHELYLRAQYLKNKGGRSNLQRSAEYFQQAIQRDPDYGLAYSGLADSYRLLALTGSAPALEVFPKSLAAATRALTLAENLAEAHSAMGSVKLWFERSLPDAEREFRRAIELNPSYGWAHHDYAWLLVAAGRFDEAITQIRQAQALDPLSPLANSDVGWVYLFARRYPEAIDQIKRTLDLEPGFSSARACLVQAYIYNGMVKEALMLGIEDMTQSGAAPPALPSIDSAQTAVTLRNFLVWRLGNAQALAGRGGSASAVAELQAALGYKDEAFRWLDKAAVDRDPMFVFVNVDPAYDSLRSDPRFAALIGRTGLSL